jgi:thymidylate synthase
MDEEGYINLLRKILEEGNEKSDRTGVGTLSLFGAQLRFNLENQFPLLTTKKMYTKGIIHELLWFLRGCTDSKLLEKEKVNIWKANTTREFLDNRGLTDYEVGDLGPMYGFQWRHFNAEYRGCSEDYSNQGVDQLTRIVNEIKSTPDSRRLLMTTFNPESLDRSCLMPCHGIAIQFYVNKGELSCHMYQRSVDYCCGLPYNIASYSLLTYMIAQVTGLKPKELIISMGDTHIYKSHIENARIQADRIPLQFPTLTLNPAKQGIEDFECSDFEIREYECHSALKYEMAV